MVKLAPKIKPEIKVPLSKAVVTAEKMARTIKGGEVFALIGELGAGKTTFTKALGKALGVTRNIPSPTFVMIQEFPIPKSKPKFLYHLDLYRTKNFTEVESLGITQWWGHPETITVIEWADKILKNLPANTTIIHLYRDEQ
jgi:tRNA threonylcarbamoyladenosine biosynthesis protein TsaE